MDCQIIILTFGTENDSTSNEFKIGVPKTWVLYEFNNGVNNIDVAWNYCTRTSHDFDRIRFWRGLNFSLIVIENDYTYIHLNLFGIFIISMDTKSLHVN